MGRPRSLPAGAQAPPRHRYRRRFLLAYAILVLALAAAAIGLAVALDRDETTPARGAATPALPPADSFSDFRSSARGLDRAQAVADHVARSYRNVDGKTLVVVTADAPIVANIPIRAIAVRGARSNGLANDDVSVVPAANDLTYKMCGLGAQCRLAGGQPSAARYTLLRREALELALLSMHELPDIGSVLVYLPPVAGSEKVRVLFFQRSELAEHLGRPLRATVPPGPVRLGSAQAPSGAVDLAVLERLTRTRQFNLSIRQMQDGSPLLLLEPLLGSGA